ncbi:MAG: tetratricopeptide repeat protein [Phycisphaerae bacterium]|nr:tetratricopeptide repeat protein [Phycisphaerae bacterium]NUQ46671.1 tetratricopeptide repeat protein [Phycisphaerae bacterium]
MVTTQDLSTLIEQPAFDSDILNGMKALAFSSHESLARFVELTQGQERAIATGKAEGRPAALKLGLCHWLLGRPRQALEWLSKGGDSKERHYYAGLCQRDLGDNAAARQSFEKAATHGWDALVCACEQAESVLMAGDIDAAKKLLDDHGRNGLNAAAWHYVMGRLQDRLGNLDAAIDRLNRAIELDPRHTRALFHLAYLTDLHGKEETAIDLYRRCIACPPILVNALINLAVLLEDAGDNTGAEQCLRRVLATHPNHARAQLFLKDVVTSSQMVIDEEWERVSEQRSAIMDTPINDFELSVRSRNCLKKLDICTLGDLCRVTEAELLAYKNFGDTSLLEIKAMLTQKGLRLGQLAEQGGAPQARSVMRTRMVVTGSPEVLNKPVTELELSVRSRKCLQKLGLVTVGELISRSEAELLSIRNFGQTSLNEIKRRLTELGVSLRTS